MNFIQVEGKEHCNIIRIHRPESLNALSEEVLRELEEAFQALQSSAPLCPVVLTGSGEKSFVAGADIQAMAGYDAAKISDYVSLGQRVMRSIEKFPAPVIAAVNGYALGGGMELALACDLIYAAKKAIFGQPEVCLGILPGFGGTQRLTWRCGVGTAKRLIFTGEKISADEALRLGVVEGVFEDSELLTKVEKIAQQIMQNAPLAVASSKKVIHKAIESQLQHGLEVEVHEFCELFQSKDREEGMQAFLEKRKPEYKGT